MKKGRGKKWIGEKVGKLRGEGYGVKQAVAVAHRMAGASKGKGKGGRKGG